MVFPLDFLDFGIGFYCEVLAAGGSEPDIRIGCKGLIVLYRAVLGYFIRIRVAGTANSDIVFNHRVLGDASLAALRCALTAFFSVLHIRVKHTGILLLPLFQIGLVFGLSQLVNLGFPCFVISTVRNVCRFMRPSHAAAIIADKAAAVIDPNVVGDYIVTATANQKCICLHICKQVISRNGTGSHVVQINAIGAAVCGIRNVVEIVVGNYISTACPVTGTGVDCTGVTRFIQDIRYFIACHQMIVSREGDCLVRCIGNLIACHLVSTSENTHRRGIGSLDNRIIIKVAVIHFVIAGCERKDFSALQQDSAGACVLKIAALDGVIVVVQRALHCNTLLTHIGKQAIRNQNVVTVIQINCICVTGSKMQAFKSNIRSAGQIEKRL